MFVVQQSTAITYWKCRTLVIFDILFKVLRCKYGDKSVTYGEILLILMISIEASKIKKIPVKELTENSQRISSRLSIFKLR